LISVARPGGRRTGGADDDETSGFLAERDLVDLEKTYPDGMTAAQVVELFKARGIKLSEATFRKYVQLGLLPRSRRVGRKGKHRGSMGLYPATVVRRVNDIRQLMAGGYTIEDIQRSFLRFKDDLESLERGLSQVFTGFERELKGAELDGARRRALNAELTETRRLADDLLARLEHLERQIVSPLERAARARAFSSGASGGAGDLL
jgi:DNA-binding transcriptional MerR regulator